MANTNLVLLTSDNQLVTTSKIIADTVGYDHSTVLKLIRNHLQELETFGKVIFQTLDAHYNEVATSFNAENVFKNQNYRFEMSEETSGRPTEIAILNEHQTYLLIMFMRNNKTVTTVKVEFVRAFFNMRQALQNQQKQLEHLSTDLELEVVQALENHKEPTNPALKSLYKRAQQRGIAIARSYAAKNQLEGFYCIPVEEWERMQTIPTNKVLVDRKQFEHVKEMLQWWQDNRLIFQKAFETTSEIAENLQQIKNAAGVLTWGYTLYNKEVLSLSA